MPRRSPSDLSQYIAQAAEAEARTLLTVEANGCGGPCAVLCRDVRHTVGVPREIRAGLEAYAVAYPEERKWVEGAMAFRLEVAKAITRLRMERRAA